MENQGTSEAQSRGQILFGHIARTLEQKLAQGVLSKKDLVKVCSDMGCFGPNIGNVILNPRLELANAVRIVVGQIREGVSGKNTTIAAIINETARAEQIGQFVLQIGQAKSAKKAGRAEKCPATKVAGRTANRVRAVSEASSPERVQIDPYWEDPVISEESRKNTLIVWTADQLRRNPYDITRHEFLADDLYDRYARGDKKKVEKFPVIIRAYRVLLILQPTDRGLPHIRIGEMLFKMGQYEEAIPEFRAALPLFTLGPNEWLHDTTYEMLAEALLYTEHYEECVQTCRAYTNVFGERKSSRIQYALGRVCVRLGQVEEGIQTLKDAICLYPDFHPPYADLGKALTHCGKHREARRVLEISLQLSDDDPEFQRKTKEMIGKIPACQDERTSSHRETLSPQLQQLVARLGELMGHYESKLSRRTREGDFKTFDKLLDEGNLIYETRMGPRGQAYSLRQLRTMRPWPLIICSYLRRADLSKSGKRYLLYKHLHKLLTTPSEEIDFVQRFRIQKGMRITTRESDRYDSVDIKFLDDTGKADPKAIAEYVSSLHRIQEIPRSEARYLLNAMCPEAYPYARPTIMARIKKLPSQLRKFFRGIDVEIRYNN